MIQCIAETKLLIVPIALNYESDEEEEEMDDLQDDDEQ